MLFIHLFTGVPDVLLAKPKKTSDGYCFAVTINAIPAPYFVQWSIKENNPNTFEAIDINAKKYKGTSNSLPDPVLVINQSVDELETCCFQIKVKNFIGNCKRIIPGTKASNVSFRKYFQNE